MQAAETACLWKYQYRSNSSSPSSLTSHLSSTKGAMDNITYLACTKRLACADEMSAKATYFCIQCNALQCVSCEKEIHRKADVQNHERLNVYGTDDEHCSVDRSHPAVFYCPTCASSFCYSCFEDQHQDSDGKEHKRQECKGQLLRAKNKTDQHRSATNPIKITSSSNANKNMYKERTATAKQARPKFEDVNVNDSDESAGSPPIQYVHSPPSKTSNSRLSRHNNNLNHIPTPDNFDQQMLIDSMLEGDDDEADQIDNNHAPKNTNRLSHRRQSSAEPGDVFLLLDAKEHLAVSNPHDFAQQLSSSAEDSLVKCVSILGNTGDGKSHTLNQIFYHGHEKFHTSAKPDSCTIGAWAALDESRRTLVLDTEGRLGLSQNDNIRSRLLLKILCVSDIVIYRTKAPKLPNDMFQFLSDASAAFLKYFKKEIENVMRICNADGPMSVMGPTLVIFHETQHTEVLRDDFKRQKTAVEQLKERFERMKLPYDAYSSIEYVGIQTLDGKKTDFSDIKKTITDILENNNSRSRRHLSVIFKALKALNEKFNHDIPPEMPSILPDDFFACCFKCLSCGTKCTMPANHQKENVLHQCTGHCTYKKELDNEVWKCLACHRQGRDMIVYGKLITKGDSLVQGLLKYVWSGFVIECPHHGEIYRSRKYWYGNNGPTDVTRVEVIHVWPGDDTSRLASDVTPRKFMEMVVHAGSYLSAPTKMISELVADQVAPAYWVPNKYVENCYLCNLEFGTDFYKHHCRACGKVFCDTCTTNRRIVPWIDPHKATRVCKKCHSDTKLQPPSSTSAPPSSTLSDRDRQTSQRSKHSGHESGSSADSSSAVSSGEHLSDLCLTPSDILDIDQSGAGPVSVDMPTARRFYETFVNGLEKIGANYPITLIKESTRPTYWRPDKECRACYICKREFDSTINRLHHCRNCGDGVCEKCSPSKRCVPERDWLTPVRVCKQCDQAMNEENQ